MPSRGFLPCFSKYRHQDFPIDNLYTKNGHISKLKHLLSCLIDSKSPLEIKQSLGREIQVIRPTDKESKRLISLFGLTCQLYRIDYGNTPFRILFGLSNQNREAYVVAIDTNHSTYKRGRR
ncbi:hypothetical protein KKE34_03495 [Patescibacteria group bacterium]|nr:hypothetical protein [Patescibacteria group bacterium]MBU1885647.1 hypothetical protein [Patescibacteria group bacterium]